MTRSPVARAIQDVLARMASMVRPGDEASAPDLSSFDTDAADRI